jgi:predicted kinase
MVHAEGGGFQAAAGDPLTQRTLPLFFDVLRMLLAGGVTVVAEASLQDQLWRHGLEPLTDTARLRIVQCHASPAVGRERRRSAIDAGGQAAHAKIIGDETEDWERAYASFDRLSISAPSIDVDTTDGLRPALEEIIEFVNRH